MVNVRPATVMVPVRAADVLAPTLKATVPLPEPAAPEVTVIQGSDATAVQSHVAPVVTVMGVPVPPALPNDADVGANVYVQPVACDTATVWPATVSVPLRGPPALAAAAKVTLPLPLPDVPFVIESQLALLDAIHAHVGGAVTVTVRPLAPDAPTVCDV